MTSLQLLDARSLLGHIADRVPAELRDNVVVVVVVVGSIATAWAFRDVSGRATVSTKDIDLLLRPAVEATTTAEALAEQLLLRNWRPIYPNDRRPGAAETPDDELPALRLSHPGDGEGWFVALLGAPLPEQVERRAWRRFDTSVGVFALPCFRHMSVAIHAAEQTEFGIRSARPARMALSHLLSLASGVARDTGRTASEAASAEEAGCRLRAGQCSQRSP
ncbi:MAG: hypothetical protein IPK97_16255 [Ahniella sp.]|nr:hypothetical protein [Ahniella sp.]